MSISPQSYEDLGAFYLGREMDSSNQGMKEEPLLYDSKDLVTHGVVLGMTGSGKTGLCMALLEEAAMDSIPAIVIDPKGDIPNLMLTFPEFRGEDFRPWINEEEARKKRGRRPRNTRRPRPICGSAVWQGTGGKVGTACASFVKRWGFGSTPPGAGRGFPSPY